MAWRFCSVFLEEKIASWDFNLCQFTYQLFSCFYESSHDLHVLLLAVFSVIVRGTSFTGLSLVFIIHFMDFCSRTAEIQVALV